MDKHEEQEIISEIDDKQIDVEKDEASKTNKTKEQEKSKRGLHMPVTKKGKAGLGLAVLVLLLGIISIIPFTRYGLYGLFIKKDVQFTLVDSVTSKPVSGAKISLGRHDAVSEADGRVKIGGVAVGDHTLNIEKKYYESSTSNYRVPILASAKDQTLKLQATGRTITVTVSDSLNGKPLSGVKLEVSDASAETGENGEAQLVLPVKRGEQTGTAELAGYNSMNLKLNISGTDQKLQVQMIPSGKVYFLSKRTGKIDVMSSNLDGSDQQTVLAGTGKENATDSRLVPSGDWSRLALIANRDGTRSKLYNIEPGTGKVTLMQDDDVTYDPIGWNGDTFYYKVFRNDRMAWQGKTSAIIAYNVPDGTRKTLDETGGVGTNGYNYATEFISPAYMVDGAILYAKYWSYSTNYPTQDHPVSIMKITTVGNARAIVKDVPLTASFVDNMMNRPNQVMFRIGEDNTNVVRYFAYTGGKLTETKMTDNDYYASRINYLMSPDRSKSLWAEVRDGQNVILAGDAAGEKVQQLSKGKYLPYGWYGEKYVLYSLNGSELFITSAGGPFDGARKITNYHSQNAGQNQQPSGWGYGSY